VATLLGRVHNPTKNGHEFSDLATDQVPDSLRQTPWLRRDGDNQSVHKRAAD